MKNKWLFLLIALPAIYGCEDCGCVPPPDHTLGEYIGPYSYIYQGKNPIDGAFYEDTTYTDTFTVLSFAFGDSIRFSNDAFYMDFKMRGDQFYQAGPSTNYRLSGSDSMYFDSYFYSGTDADHFYSETFSFRGKR